MDKKIPKIAPSKNACKIFNDLSVARINGDACAVRDLCNELILFGICEELFGIDCTADDFYENVSRFTV